MFRFVLLTALLGASVQAFTTPSIPTRIAKPSLTQNSMLTMEEIDAILGKGTHCEEGECTIAEVDDLIEELQDQQHQLSERIKNVDKMVKSLEIMNLAEDREVDEVRETVRAIFRVFAMSDKASGNDLHQLTKPTGYSGEVGSGPTDAYKALNPKPWKASP